MTYDAIVVGAGLAGCSAAVQLAGAGFRVLLLEKQRYPVHKLCGEFLSVEVSEAFRRLGVYEAVQHARPAHITRTLVTSPGGHTFASDLPGVALGLSRYRLDYLLLQHAEAQGAVVRQGEAVRRISGTLAGGFDVATDRGTYRARVVFGAYGKRSKLDRQLGRPFMQRREPFVAFKGHFRAAELDGTIELHAFEGGYCGLSHVEDGVVNACWITHEDVLKDAGGNAETMIEGAFRKNDVLASRFGRMERISDGYLAISQVSFTEKGKFDGDVCMIGDTGGMITPLCGDGMAMALRSSELAVPLAARFLSGMLSAQAFKQTYERVWRREFKTRMAIGRFVHHGFVRPPLARVGVRGLSALPNLGRWLIRNTRG